MSDSITERLGSAIKEAMRARDSDRLAALRFLQAAIKQKEVDERKEPSNEEVMSIVERQVKQRRESIAAFEAAGRQDSADKEKRELAVLQEFLPQAASQEEVVAIIDKAIENVLAQGASGGAAMGKIMAQVKPALAGRANMAEVSALVKEKLNN